MTLASTTKASTTTAEFNNIKYIKTAWTRAKTVERKNYLSQQSDFLAKIELFFSNLFKGKYTRLNNDEYAIVNKICQALVKDNIFTLNFPSSHTFTVMLNDTIYKLVQTVEDDVCSITLKIETSNTELEANQNCWPWFSNKSECEILKCKLSQLTENLNILNRVVVLNTRLDSTINMHTVTSLFENKDIQSINGLLKILKSFNPTTTDINTGKDLHLVKSNLNGLLDKFSDDDILNYLKFCRNYKICSSDSNNQTNETSHEWLDFYRKKLDKAIAHNKSFEDIVTLPTQIKSILNELNEPQKKFGFIKSCEQMMKNDVKSNVSQNITDLLNKNEINFQDINNSITKLEKLQYTTDNIKFKQVLAQHCKDILYKQFNSLKISEQIKVMEIVHQGSSTQYTSTDNTQSKMEQPSWSQVADNFIYAFSAFKDNNIGLSDTDLYTLFGQNLLAYTSNTNNPPITNIAEIHEKFIGNSTFIKHLTDKNLENVDYNQSEIATQSNKTPTFGDLHANGLKNLLQLKLIFPIKNQQRYEQIVKLCENYQDHNLKYKNLSWLFNIPYATHSRAQRRDFEEQLQRLLPQAFDIENPKAGNPLQLLARWLGDFSHDRNIGDLIIFTIFTLLNTQGLYIKYHIGNHDIARMLRTQGLHQYANEFSDHNKTPYSKNMLELQKDVFLSTNAVLFDLEEGNFYSHAQPTANQFIQACELLQISVADSLKKNHVENKNLSKQEEEFKKLLKQVNRKYRELARKIYKSPDSITQDEIKALDLWTNIGKNCGHPDDGSLWKDNKNVQSMTERYSFIHAHISAHNPAPLQQFERGVASLDNSNGKNIPSIHSTELVFWATNSPKKIRTKPQQMPQANNNKANTKNSLLEKHMYPGSKWHTRTI